MMDIFLDDSSQVTFPGNNVSGVFCVRECSNLAQMPVIMVTGYTSIVYQLGTKEINEYLNFFEGKAKVSLKGVDNSNESLKNRYKDYLTIFTFYLTLPNNLPSSHEVPFGHTRYKLEAYFNDQRVSTFFSVNKWVDLNQNNAIVVKFAFYPILSIRKFCSARLYLDRLNYFSGETVIVRAVIKNNSKIDVLSSNISIEQITKYWITGYKKPLKFIRAIAESSNSPYLHTGEENEYKYSLSIPSVIPSTRKCREFFINYEVQYNIKMSVHMHNLKNFELNQKLFIGNKSKISDHLSLKIIHREAEELEHIIEFKPNYLIYVN